MINFETINPKQKITITAASWLAALTLLVYLIVLPLLAQIKKDGQELAQKKQSMELFYQEQQNLEKAQKDYLARQSEINALPALLPAGEALKFILLVEQLAQSTRHQQTVSLLEKEKNEKAKNSTNALGFQINLRGNFPDLMKFLTYLENAPYYNDVSALRIQRLTAKDDPSVLTGDINTLLTISAYQ